MGLQANHRRSIRLKGYDYSQAGAYFITICCQNRTNMFGVIQNGVMQLHDAGKMVEKWYVELGNKFFDMECGEMIVMPNHIHFIMINVGADLRVCPNIHDEHVLGEHILGEHVLGEHVLGEHIGTPLHVVVQWFKTMTTNAYIRGVTSYHWQRFNKRMWQRNYYEHIIRNENEYNRIVQYIIDNPAKWGNDQLNNENIKEV